MALTIQQIIDASDREVSRVKCPEWGGEVCMLPFSGNDRDWYDQIYSEKRWPADGKEPDWQGLRAAAVARALCDDTGERQAATEADVLALGSKNGAALDRCYRALRDASALHGAADEEAEKN